jgi:hypothetical protein
MKRMSLSPWNLDRPGKLIFQKKEEKEEDRKMEEEMLCEFQDWMLRSFGTSVFTVFKCGLTALYVRWTSQMENESIGENEVSQLPASHVIEAYHGPASAINLSTEHSQMRELRQKMNHVVSFEAITWL